MVKVKMLYEESSTYGYHKISNEKHLVLDDLKLEVLATFLFPIGVGFLSKLIAKKSPLLPCSPKHTVTEA